MGAQPKEDFVIVGVELPHAKLPPPTERTREPGWRKVREPRAVLVSQRAIALRCNIPDQ